MHETKNIVIRESDGQPAVTIRGWQVRDEKLAQGHLMFRAQGGPSQWEFIYILKPAGDDLRATVLRVHDQQISTGRLTR